MIINAFFLDEKSSAAFKLVVVSITSEYSNDSFKVSEGERFAPNFFRLGDFNSSQLIVMYSEISFHFCKDCRIFREGVKEAIIDAINRN